MERSELYEVISKEYANWEIDPRPLGNGSNGVVFQMVNKESQEKRALKVITIPHDDTEIAKRRNSGFSEDELIRDYSLVKDKVLDEIINVIQLRGNANVVHIFGYRELRQKDQIGWIVSFDMEYLPSMSEIRPLTEPEIIQMGSNICNALKACHGRNIIHRDVKPQNILRRGDSFVLADFGESKIVSRDSSLSLRGTYDYMAPELVRHQKYTDVSPATLDIYSLGMTLYLYANYNRLPYIEAIKEMMFADVRDEANTRRWNTETLPKPAGASDRFGRIILCASQSDPRRRYQSCAEMEYDLQRVNTNETLICDSRYANVPTPTSNPQPQASQQTYARAQQTSGYAATVPQQQVYPQAQQQVQPQAAYSQPQQAYPQPQSQYAQPAQSQQMYASSVQQYPKAGGTVPVQSLSGQQPPYASYTQAPSLQVPRSANPYVQSMPAPQVQPMPTAAAKPVKAEKKAKKQKAPAQTAQTAQTAKQDKPKKKKKKLVLGLVFTLVTLALAAGVIWFFLFRNHSKLQYTYQDVPNRTIDAELYQPTVDHYYECLLERLPTQKEYEEAYQSIRDCNGDTTTLVKKLIKSSEYEARIQNSDLNMYKYQYVTAVVKACFWTDDWKKINQYYDIASQYTVDAFLDEVFHGEWLLDHPSMTVSHEHEGEEGWYTYRITNPAYPDKYYEMTAYLYDAETGKLITFENGARDYVGKTKGTPDMDLGGPVLPKLEKGKYRYVIRGDQYGTVYYDEGFVVE